LVPTFSEKMLTKYWSFFFEKCWKIISSSFQKNIDLKDKKC
jgi:hypothetical protein